MALEVVNAQGDILDRAGVAVGMAYAAAGGEPNAAPPVSIISIILQIIMSLLGGGLGGACPKPTGGTVKAMVTNPTLRVQLRVKRAVQQQLLQQYGWGGYRLHNGDQMVEAILKAGAAAQESDIQAMIDTAAQEVS